MAYPQARDDGAAARARTHVGGLRRAQDSGRGAPGLGGLGFSARHTGAPLANLDFAPLGAVQLNDVAIGPDGKIYITDTGIIMGPKGVIHLGPDRIFVVGANRQITVAAEGP